MLISSGMTRCAARFQLAGQCALQSTTTKIMLKIHISVQSHCEEGVNVNTALSLEA